MPGMSKRIWIGFVFFINGLSGNAQGAIQEKIWKSLELPNGWYISVPEGFQREDGLGVDSRVGRVYSLKDSIRIEFDIGTDYNIIFDKVDCSLKSLTTKAKNNLQLKSTRQTYSI